MDLPAAEIDLTNADVLAQFAESLTGVEVDELTVAEEEALAAFNALAEKPSKEDLVEMRRLATIIEAIRAEGERRVTEAAEAQAEAEELKSRIAKPEEASEGDEGDPAPEPDPEPEPETVEVPEPVEAKVPEKVAASKKGGAITTPRPTVAQVAAFKPKQATIPVPESARVSITAGADNQSVSTGAKLPSLDDVNRLIHERTRGFLRSGNSRNDGERSVVASIEWELPGAPLAEDATPHLMASMAQDAKVMDDLTASGICGPLNTDFRLQTVGSTDRPVYDGLPKTDGSRGGVRFIRGPVLSAVTGAITTLTSAQDDAGNVTKNCLEVDCGDIVEVIARAFSTCLTFSNFTDTFYPESRPAWVDLAMVAWARQAEAQAMTDITNAGVAITSAAAYGATATMVAVIQNIVAAYRSARRDYNSTLVAIFPAWVRNLIKVDIARTRSDDVMSHFNVSDAEVNAVLANEGLVAIFQLDDQVLALPAAGVLASWPTSVRWQMFPAGTWAMLDQRRIDIGVQRDGTLNRTNRFQVFSEGFEAPVRFGVDSFSITTTLCADGSYAPSATLLTCPHN